MPKTRINCPNCRQPIMADVQQLFDAGAETTAKQQLLSGLFNIVQCPYCGYQGNLATPIVYHDPGKELLLTFVPPELGLPRDEQERLIGSLMNQVINRLSPEQRKGYLLRPQAHLTMQSLVERILEADGITREMIQAQQQRLNLLQRLLAANDLDVRIEIIKQEEKLIDADLFNLLGRLTETAEMSGDRESAKKLEDLQGMLLENTDIGRQIKNQTDEVQTAIQSLQQIGRELTREKLLDLIIQAPNDTRVGALVSLTRPGMDYVFFQMLSERIEKASGEERERLISLRELLLDLTRQIDAQIELKTVQARNLLDTILKSENITDATAQHISEIDEFFLQVLNAELETSRKVGDLEKISNLQEIAGVLQQASAPIQEITFIQDLLEADDQDRRKLMEENRDQITPQFFEILSVRKHQAER